MKHFVAYYRVSTQKQGESGLGLEAQRHTVEEFIRRGNGVVIAEYVEVETGKRADRPKLAEAVALCKAQGHTLLVAKLDRLSRNLHFITQLQASDVDFLACDNPHATPFLIHILGAVAEYEATMISTRTKQALAAAKARGVKLGNPRFNSEDMLRAAQEAKLSFAKEVYPVVQQIRASGVTTYEAVAQCLNARGIPTRQGKRWHGTTVRNLELAVSV